MRPNNMLTSVRASCNVLQSPFFANVTILVEYKATQMSIKSGTDAKRVRNPTNSNVPHTISTTPTNVAITCGHGIPIFTKRPTPNESGNRNFCMPSERKTQPTRIRISKTALDARSAQVASVFSDIEFSSFLRALRCRFNGQRSASFRYSTQVAPTNARIYESQPNSQALPKAQAT